MKAEQPQTEPHVTGAPGEPPKADDKLLDLVLAKTESTKKDLEKNWSYQITSVGVSLGVVLGLGDPLAEKYFEVPGYVRVLYLVLPLVNLYLFMRFGSLASAFSEARFAAEKLAKKYFKDNRLDSAELSGSIEPSVIYATNSYFEYFHHGDASLAKFAYSLFLPFLFALSHSVSLYLLLMFFGFNLLAYVLCALYCVPVLALYFAYYQANKNNPFLYSSVKWNFLLFTNFLAVLLAAVFLYYAIRYGDGGILFNLGPTDSPGSLPAQ